MPVSRIRSMQHPANLECTISESEKKTFCGFGTLFLVTFLGDRVMLIKSHGKWIIAGSHVHYRFLYHRVRRYVTCKVYSTDSLSTNKTCSWYDNDVSRNALASIDHIDTVYESMFKCVRIYIYIIREEAQSFATHDLRCRACLPNSKLAVWWTSVSRWFLT